MDSALLKLGKTVMSVNGQKIKAIKLYKSSYSGDVREVDAQFDDGTIVEHVDSWEFVCGAVLHPDVNKRKCRNRYTGEMMTITNCYAPRRASRGAYVDIKFEDGTVIEYVYSALVRCGTIEKVKGDRERAKAEHPFKKPIGEIGINKAGILMKVVGYESATNISVQFEDGYVATGAWYANFKYGNIPHNTLKLAGRGVCKGSTMGLFDVYSKAQVNEDRTTYYKCKCRRCGFTGILTPHEMLAHVCG